MSRPIILPRASFLRAICSDRKPLSRSDSPFSATREYATQFQVVALIAVFLLIAALPAIAQSGDDSDETFLKGWESKAFNSMISSVSEAEASPLSSEGKKYVQVEGTIDGSSAVSYGTVFLNYTPPSGADAPSKISFRFRPDTTGQIRYYFFDADKAQPSTGSNATWHIDCVGGYWRLMVGGAEEGAPEQQIKTGIKASPGMVYTFVIETYPQERRWSVTISDDTQTLTFNDLHFRSAKQELGGHLHFGFSTDSTQKPTEFSYSFSDIRMDSLALTKP